jgi:hypothetical protein
LICPEQQQHNEDKKSERSQDTEHTDVGHVLDKGLFLEVKTGSKKHGRVQDAIHDLVV